MTTSSQPNTLIEHVSDWHTGLKIDRTNRTVRNIALTGITSKNGYRYTEQALRAAASLYEDKPVFLDHAIDKARPQERSTRDLVGTIVNPRYETGRIRGDIRVLDTDSGRTFLALSESDAPGVGMSHVVLAQRTTPGGEVDRIHDVVSVDAVVFPATTRTFRESLTHLKDETAPHDKEERAPAVQTGAEPLQIEKDSGTATAPKPTDSGLHDQLQQLLCERDRLLSRLRDIRDQEEADSRKQAVERQLQSARLPEYAVTAEFRRQLHDVDEPARTALIDERRRLIDAAGRQAPQSIERNASRQAADVNQAFIAAIKRSTI